MLVWLLLASSLGFEPVKPTPPQRALGLAPGTKIFPGLQDKDIVELLDKVPVFSLVDNEGNSAAVKDGNSSRLEFFLDAKHALRRRDQMVGGEKLRLVGQSLGRALIAYESSSDITAHFLADPRELVAARQIILRGVDPDAAAQNMTAQELLAAYALADPQERFGTAFDVPLFSIAQLMLAADDDVRNPWFFSMQDCVDQWKSACAGNAKAYESGEIRLLSLKEIIEQMRAPQPEDNHKSRLFVPSKAALLAIGVQPPTAN